jgi:hypothetical protein
LEELVLPGIQVVAIERDLFAAGGEESDAGLLRSGRGESGDPAAIPDDRRLRELDHHRDRVLPGAARHRGGVHFAGGGDIGGKR